VITWAVGHLVQLAEPEEYDAKWKKWKMADLPIVPPNGFRLVPRDAKSKKQLKLIETLLKREDIDKIINACDAGREGELIFAYVYESVFGSSATTLKAPQPDRLIHGTFQPPYQGLWFEGDETRIFGDLARADAIVAKVSGQDGTVEKVERKEQSERAPLLYDLTSLQRDANRRYGFSARRTLQAAQSLYESKKAITYPRTSSRFLSGDMVPQLKPTAATLQPIEDYRKGAEFVLALDQLPLGRVVNDAKVSDHHAVIPTDIEKDLESFSPDERRVFDLVAKRFLAV